MIKAILSRPLKPKVEHEKLLFSIVPFHLVSNSFGNSAMSTSRISRPRLQLPDSPDPVR
jgi:hypothetical protein